MRRIPLCLLVCLSVLKGEDLANWQADYPPCDRHTELLKRGHMDLGVRVATNNPALARQFKRAMDSWARILDLDWHPEDSGNCAIEVLDGSGDLFQSIWGRVAARAQFPDRADFQGWIVFNPGNHMDETELYWTAVHEIGHMLGLPHSSDAKSIMYFFALDGTQWLDTKDLATLAKRHKLRIAKLNKPIALTHAK